jgi:hypothetical protein
MKYCSAIKKNEIMSFAAKWMELEIIMFSEISQTQKHKYCMFSLNIKSRAQKNEREHKKGTVFRKPVGRGRGKEMWGSHI